MTASTCLSHDKLYRRVLKISIFLFFYAYLGLIKRIYWSLRLWSDERLDLVSSKNIQLFSLDWHKSWHISAAMLAMETLFMISNRCCFITTVYQLLTNDFELLRVK